ncbi:MAG TPA: hypothetical protein VKV27_11575 [Solirubrobacteraceae bacterium]|nr:hypothetical protein [Solirubrobacteraceae bacterium]
MNDDWRLRVELADGGQARALGRLLEDPGLEHDLVDAFQDRVVVSVDGSEVFCYAGSREQTERARRLVEDLARRHGWRASMQVSRWHPVAERWEDPAVPVATRDAPGEPEHEERIARERAESEHRGYPEWEVSIRCRSRQHARELSERLQQDGLAHVRRFRYVLIGAEDEDSARRLAEALGDRVPEGSEVMVAGNPRAVLESRPWSPFSVLGGLGG